MFLRDKISNDLVEITDVSALFDPNKDAVSGRFHAGEEMQDVKAFSKADLAFPSGESLPRCWVDVHYRD